MVSSLYLRQPYRSITFHRNSAMWHASFVRMGAASTHFVLISFRINLQPVIGVEILHCALPNWIPDSLPSVVALYTPISSHPTLSHHNLSTHLNLSHTTWRHESTTRIVEDPKLSGVSAWGYHIPSGYFIWGWFATLPREFYSGMPKYGEAKFPMTPSKRPYPQSAPPPPSPNFDSFVVFQGSPCNRPPC